MQVTDVFLNNPDNEPARFHLTLYNVTPADLGTDRSPITTALERRKLDGFTVRKLRPRWISNSSPPIKHDFM